MWPFDIVFHKLPTFDTVQPVCRVVKIVSLWEPAAISVPVVFIFVQMAVQINLNLLE